MLPYLMGASAGAAYGILAGYIKYCALWKRVLKDEKKISKEALYRHLGLSYAINITTLLLVFIFRNIMPWDFAAMLIASAVTLSLAGKLAPMNDIMTHVEEKA